MASSSAPPTPDTFSSLIRSRNSTALISLLSSLSPSSSSSSSSSLTVSALLTSYDSEGHSPLHWLSLEPRHELITALFIYLSHAKVGVDIQSRAPEQKDQTPLHWCAVHGNLFLLGKLLDLGANVHSVDHRGYNVIIHAAQYGHVEIIHAIYQRYGSQILLDSVDHTGNGIIQWAAYYSHATVIRYVSLILANDHDIRDKLVNKQDVSAMTAMHRVLSKLNDKADDDNDNNDDNDDDNDGDEDEMEENDQQTDEIHHVVDALLRAGARLDIQDSNGMSCAHMLQTLKTRLSKHRRRRRRHNRNLICASPSATATAKVLQTVYLHNLKQQGGSKFQFFRKYVFIIFFHVLIIATVLHYFFSLSVSTLSALSIYSHFFFMLMVFLSLFLHISIMLSNPGDIVLSSTSASSSSSSVVDYFNEAIHKTGALSSSRFCYICGTCRVPRSYHSRLRDRCVRRFDHDCPWIANAVGLYNHRMLLLLIMTTILGQCSFLHAVYYYCKTNHTTNNTITNLLLMWKTQPGLLMTIVLNVFILVFLSCLIVSQLRLVVTGRTTVESIMNKRQKRNRKGRNCDCRKQHTNQTNNNNSCDDDDDDDDDDDYHDDYNLGPCTNIIAFLTSTGHGTHVKHVPKRISDIFTMFIRSLLVVPGRGTTFVTQEAVEESDVHGSGEEDRRRRKDTSRSDRKEFANDIKV